MVGDSSTKCWLVQGGECKGWKWACLRQLLTSGRAQEVVCLGRRVEAPPSALGQQGSVRALCLVLNASIVQHMQSLRHKAHNLGVQVASTVQVASSRGDLATCCSFELAWHKERARRGVLWAEFWVFLALLTRALLPVLMLPEHCTCSLQRVQWLCYHVFCGALSLSIFMMVMLLFSENHELQGFHLSHYSQTGEHVSKASVRRTWFLRCSARLILWSSCTELRKITE